MNRILFCWRSIVCLLLCLQLVFPVGSRATTEQSRKLQVEAMQQQKKAALWVLAIGVSEYADGQINLKYADHDAEQIARLFSTQQGALFREVFTRVLVNEKATREGIIMAMSKFLGQASRDDVVLIFLAGHGLQDRQTGTYYFVPHNANADNLVSEGLAMPTFNEACKRLKTHVNKLVLWLDTCHAGAVNVAARAGVNVGEDLSEALRKAEGQYVLSASKAGEESLEDETYRLEGEDRAHGAFTYSLLRGLQGMAADTSGVVWLSELVGHVSREVPRLTTGKQHPYQQVQGTNLPLFVLEEGGSVFPPIPPARPGPGLTEEKSKGSKKWLWLLLGVGVLGGGAAVVGVSDGGPDGPSAIPPPPDHP